MDVIRIADVDRHGHARVRQVQRLELRLAQVSPGVSRAPGRPEVRKLDEQEGEFVLAPGAPPVANHGRESPSVLVGAVDVRLALVPDGATDGNPGQRRDHGIVEACGAPVTQAGILQQRRGRHGTAFGLSLPGQGAPLIQFRQVVVQPGRSVTNGRVPLRQQRLEVGVRLEGLPGHPCLHRRAAPRGVDQPDGNAHRLVQVAPEEVAHGREALSLVDRRWRRDSPVPGNVFLRPARHGIGCPEQPDHGTVGLQHLFGTVSGERQLPRHV